MLSLLMLWMESIRLPFTMHKKLLRVQTLYAQFSYGDISLFFWKNMLLFSW